MIDSTQHSGLWFFIAFVLAILLSFGLRPDRPTRVFLDSPSGRARYLDLSRLCVPAVKPTKFSLRREEGGKAAHDERLTSLSTLSLDDALLHAVDTGPPLSDRHGPPVLGRTAPRLKLQGLPVPTACKAGKTTLRTRENPAPARVGVLQHVIFTTGFSYIFPEGVRPSY
jgi:hypothetical protein